MIEPSIVFTSSGTGRRIYSGAPDPATDLSSGAGRVEALRSLLNSRSTHPQVEALCTADLFVRDNLEAAARCTDALLARIRRMTGQETGTAAMIVELALRPGRSEAMLSINAGQAPGDRTEQRGLYWSIRGILDLYQRPSRFDTRPRRLVTDLELNELLTSLSLLHHQLDRTNRTEFDAAHQTARA